MNIPALRFPEFKGEWEKKKLGEVSDEIMYGMNAAAIPFDGKNKYIRITDIDESSRTFVPKPLTSPEGLIEEKYKLKIGDILFTRTGASVGKSYLYKKEDGNVLFAGFLIKFSIIGANPYFIFSQTLKSSYDKWVVKMSMRSGQPGLNAEEYKDFKISFPALPEQTKIATFLTSVDEKLQTLKKKQSLLGDYKKGVMQRIFSQKLRFKDKNGKEFTDWEVKKLGDVAKITTGSTPSTLIDEYYNGNKLFVSPADLQGNRFVNQTKTTLTELGFSKGRLIPKGSVLFVCIGSTIGKIAIANDECLTNQQINSLTANINYKNDFIFSLLEFNRDEIKLMAGVQAVPQINKTDFSNLRYHFPCLDEQTAIANFLSFIDEKINKTNNQITHAEQWKKGLLQKMFV